MSRCTSLAVAGRTLIKSGLRRSVGARPHEGDAPWQPNPVATPQPTPATTLRTAEVADILYVSPKTGSRWAKEGQLPFLKTLGGHRRYSAAQIRQLADELQVRPTA
jgi:excisionase family DNA binding protein